MFVRTTAINKIGRMKARKKIIQGGTSAGKTFGVIPILINTALKHPGKEISVVSESVPHLRRGCIKDFIKIMKLTQRWREDEYNKSLLRYDFANGSYIEFFSANDESKQRGARRNILYMNEANNITWETYYQLAIRTNQDIYIDFNPSAEFWAHTELQQDQDSELIILTYQDNEALDDTIKREIESARDKASTSSYWANWWKVYGLGQVGSLQGVVFENWSQVKKVPDQARLLGYGLDFGYTNDPSAVVALYRMDGKIIVDELLYQTGLTNKAIAEELLARIQKGATVVADSAEPKSIDEIYSRGVNIFPAQKGPDSIRNSVALLQEHEILVTETSTNLIKELRGYIWDQDRTGKKANKPNPSCTDHAIDALRYVAMRVLKQQSTDYTIY